MYANVTAGRPAGRKKAAAQGGGAITDTLPTWKLVLPKAMAMEEEILTLSPKVKFHLGLCSSVSI
jgi:hypothetical protein